MKKALQRSRGVYLPSCYSLAGIIEKRMALLFFFALSSTMVFAQNFQIAGKVTDVEGEPLPGVSITLKNSSIGATTDVNGAYTINVPGANGTLLFSYISFATQEVEIRERHSINVQLQSSSKALDEVVVIGYGTLDKKEVTSAISHISADELSSAASNDPLMKLQGKVAGLTIQNTDAGDPNSTANIQLRGVSSRSGDSSPLIVIDGVPGGNLETINENDIASIDILKDGAASAIYGTRGSNGVILITTKQGSAGALQLNYNAYTSFDKFARELKVLSAEEFRARSRGTDFGASTNWMDELTRDFGFTQKHTLSVSGGNGQTNYRASMDYQDGKGIDIRSSRKQYGARLSINHTGGEGLYNIIINAAPRFTKSTNSNRDAFTQAFNLNPTMPVMDPENPLLYYAPGGWDEFNPVENLKLQDIGGERKFLDLNATFKLNILSNLNTQVQIAQVSSDNFTFNYEPSTMTTQIKDGTKGRADREYSKYDSYSLEWLANYNLNIKKHAFKFLGVYSYTYFVNSGIDISNRDFSSDAFTYNNLDNGTYNQAAGRNGFGSEKYDSKLISFRGRVNYSFDNKYLFAASLTREGSSKFGANNKWGYFPGVSAGWRLSAEPFMKGINWINDLKVRGDYGETGNQTGIDSYQSLARYAGFAQYLYNGTYMEVWGPDNNLNPETKWEKLKNWNAGIDFTLFANRLSGSFNYYSRKAVDLLGDYNAPIPPNIVSTTTANVGVMRSNGLEIELGATIIDKNEFKYMISMNGATNNTVFVSFSNDLYQGQSFVDQVSLPSPGTPGNTQRMQEGTRIGSFYFWRHAGVDEDGNIMIYNKDGIAVPSSEALQDDKAFVGNGLPKFTAGMTHNFNYKNWDASASFRGNFGYDIFNIHNFYYGLQGASANTNVLPVAYKENAAIKGDKLLTDYFLEKGDFLKLDVVSLGYTFTSKWKSFHSARIYGSVRNVATFTKFSGLDPDTYPINGLNPGIIDSKNYYPSTTQLLVGLQLNF